MTARSPDVACRCWGIDTRKQFNKGEGGDNHAHGGASLAPARFEPPTSGIAVAWRTMAVVPRRQQRHQLLPILVAAVIASTQTWACGWGGTGHQIVCLIAEDHLTPQAKAGIKDLLREASISDAEIASWADEVRRQRRETAPWHYVNIPVEAAGFVGRRNPPDQRRR